jgi:hypothetical protein
MLQNDLRQRTAGNIGFSAMLAEEYILIFVLLPAAVRVDE